MLETEARSRGVCLLPPLVLHPFSNSKDASTLLACSRASELLNKGSSRCAGEAELERRVLEGRYCELRMLYYIGRDVVRWVDQCLDSLRRGPEFPNPEIRFQSFMVLLTETPPSNVTAKLRKWGVVDFRRVFSRAVGLNSVFAELPSQESLSPDFLREYHRYAEFMYSCRQSSCTFARLDPQSMPFEVYASGEYAELLERGLS
jgi:hypothetical protein